MDKVIGHMQSKDGENLGKLISVNKGVSKTKSKSKTCSILTKKRKKYDCEICGREFLHYGRYEVHKTFDKNIKYKCNEPD